MGLFETLFGVGEIIEQNSMDMYVRKYEDYRIEDLLKLLTNKKGSLSIWDAFAIKKIARRKASLSQAQAFRVKLEDYFGIDFYDEAYSPSEKSELEKKERDYSTEQFIEKYRRNYPESELIRLLSSTLESSPKRKAIMTILKSRKNSLSIEGYERIKRYYPDF